MGESISGARKGSNRFEFEFVNFEGSACVEICVGGEG